MNHLPRKKYKGRSPIGVSHNIREEEIHHGLFPVFLKGNFTVFNANKAADEFDEVAKYFEQWHKQHVNSLEEFRKRANARQFTKFINFSVGDYVMVSIPKQKQKSKILFRWQGPAQVIELIGEHLVRVKYVTTDKIEEVHSCRVAFYSSDLDGCETEVAEQYLYDTDKWEIKSFKDVRLTVDGEYKILTAWKGFTSLDDSWEPVTELYKQVPTFLISYLTKNKYSEVLKTLK